MSRITLRLPKPEDYIIMARLEAAAFEDDDFTAVLHGPRRSDEDVLQKLAKDMSRPGGKGELMKDVVAVNEEGEVVGYASWGTVSVEDGGIGIYGVGKETGNDKKGEIAGSKMDTMLNQKLFDDAFIISDQDMAKACKGKSYHKLFSLVVSPDHQRKGIGGILLKDGLMEADEKNLQCVLGASPQGLGLYLKHGFRIVAEHSFNLWEYERGEKMGTVGHSVLHRPAKFNV